MTWVLRNNILKYCFIILILLTLRSVFAGNKLSYYSSVIKGWGSNAKEYDGNTSSIKYSVLLTSQIKTPTFNYGNFILICDDNYKHEQISCNPSGIFSESELNIINLKDISIGLLENENSKIYIIPEYHFIDPEKAITLGAYINTVYKSSELGQPVIKTENITYETKNYIFRALLLFVSFLFSVLFYFISSLKKQQFINYGKGLSELTLQSRRYLLLLYILLIILPILVLVFLKVIGVWYNRPYITLVLNDNLSILLLSVFLSILALLTLLLILSFSQNIINAIKRIYYQFHINLWGIYLIIWLALLSRFFVSLVAYITIIAGTTTFLLIFWFIKPHIYKEISKKSILTNLVLVGIIVVFYKYWEVNVSTTSEEPIEYTQVFNKGQLQVFPVHKILEPSLRFESYEGNIPFNLFANMYLISSPIYNVISHHSYEQINESEFGIVVLPSNAEDYIRYLVTANNRHIFKTERDSEIFEVTEKIADTKADMKLTFNCNILQKADEIFLIRHNSNYSQKAHIINFPGCDRLGKTTYTVPVNIYENYIYQLASSNNTLPSDIELIQRNKKTSVSFYVPLTTKYFEVGTKYAALDKINVYVNSTLLPNDFEKENGKYNIANILNILIENKMVKGQIEFWSTSRNALLNTTL